MVNEEELKKELKMLREKRESDMRVKKLKKQIKAEKFAQTKGGKVFNAIGNFGANIGKKVFSPQKQNYSKKKKKTPARVSVNEIMARLPQ